jgi:DNA-binding response OmpR family regulator
VEKVLIVDDNPGIREVLSAGFKYMGYECILAEDGEDALEKLKMYTPDLVILDIMMPKIDGFQVCRMIKKNIFLSKIPVIVLTAKNSIEDRIYGLDEGADDYIGKPFDLKELLARARSLIRRTRLVMDRDPSTNLPGAAAVEREIQSRIESKTSYAVCYMDLDNFKAYADNYGFNMANKVIQMTARVIAGTVMLEGNEDDFVGHIGGDDFIVISTPEKFEIICQRVIKEFDEKILSYYYPEHLQKGSFRGVDREGIERDFPITTISIAVVLSDYKEFTSPSEIGQIIAEVKKTAKRIKGSNYQVLRKT